MKILFGLGFVIVFVVIFFPTIGYFYGTLITQTFQIKILVAEQREIQQRLIQEINAEIEKQNKILYELNELLEERVIEETGGGLLMPRGLK